jgi:hypothetical protein
LFVLALALVLPRSSACPIAVPSSHLSSNLSHEDLPVRSSLSGLYAPPQTLLNPGAPHRHPSTSAVLQRLFESMSCRRHPFCRGRSSLDGTAGEGMSRTRQTAFIPYGHDLLTPAARGQTDVRRAAPSPAAVDLPIAVLPRLIEPRVRPALAGRRRSRRLPSALLGKPPPTDESSSQDRVRRPGLVLLLCYGGRCLSSSAVVVVVVSLNGCGVQPLASKAAPWGAAALACAAEGRPAGEAPPPPALPRRPRPPASRLACKREEQRRTRPAGRRGRAEEDEGGRNLASARC